MRLIFIKVYCLGLLLMLTCNVTAQIKVLIFADSSFKEVNKLAMEQLIQKGKGFGIEFSTTQSIIDFKQAELNDFQSIVFLNSGIENLDLKQSNVLLNFFKKGGGFIGIHGSIQYKYKWLWFQNQINAVREVETNTAGQISLITNKQLGGLTILPYWKIFDKPFKVSNFSKSGKPVLLDFSNHPLSWISDTPLGNKAFYTLLGGTKESWSNEVFIKHLIGAIFEVSAKKSNSETLISSYPSESEFQTQILLDSIPKPQAFINISESKTLLLYDNGNIGLYDLYYNTFTKIGFESKLENVVKITKDPEFDSNNILFCFSKINDYNFLVNKISLLKDSIVLSNIELNSENHELLKVKMNSESQNDTLLSFPRYYASKALEIDQEGNIIVESVNEMGNVINKEPFPFLNKKDKLKDLSFDKYNSLYSLTTNSLLLTYYSKFGFPKRLDPQINLENGSLIKMSIGSNIELSTLTNFEWLVNGQIISREKLTNFQAKKSGNYEIEFRNYFGNRLIQKASKQFLIKIGKK